MAGRFVEARVDPVSLFKIKPLLVLIKKEGHFKQECHLLHAEVKALQNTLGISYKDVAHWLLLAEVKCVKKADSAERCFAAIQQSLDSLITSNIIPPINTIDKREFEDSIWNDRQWKKRLEDQGLNTSCSRS